MDTTNRILALDVGSSAIKWSLVDIDSRTGAVASKSPTSRIPIAVPRPEVVKASVLSVTKTALASHKVAAIAMCTSAEANIFWPDVLQPVVPMGVFDDARAATWAEYLAQPESPASFFHVTLGSTVGSSVVVNGELCAPNVGQIVHVPLAGATGSVGGAVSLAGVCEVFETKTGVTVRDFESVLNYDNTQVVQETLQAAAAALGQGLASVVALLAPDTVSIGGGLVQALRTCHAFPKAAQVFSSCVQQTIDTLVPTHSSTHLQWGLLGNDAGLVGASLLMASQI